MNGVECDAQLGKARSVSCGGPNQRRCQIDEQLNLMQGAIDTALVLQEKLESRLCSILVQEMTKDYEPERDEKILVPLANRIRSANGDISTLCKNFQSMIDRVEL